MSIRGLYVITDPELIPAHRLLNDVVQVIAGGARIVQYRNKTADYPTRLQQAREIRQVCRDRKVTFIVNDDAELAVELDADGVHIGEQDLALPDARLVVGPTRLIGVSCYNDLNRARRSWERGADYVAFGSFYSSATKPNARRASLALLRRARQELPIPIIAIGGITLENGASLLQAGADALAVIRAVFAAADPRIAAEQLASLFLTNETNTR
jgi:thiamine-phosphate pyrophosphorylase